MDLRHRFTISLLPNRVFIYTVESIKESTHSLLQALLFEKECFVSFTVSEGEVSLITDAPFEDYSVVNPHVFRVFEFHEGNSGIDHCGIVQTLSKLFSERGIEILYINSFNKNFILVKEDHLEDCQSLLGLTFKTVVIPYS